MKILNISNPQISLKLLSLQKWPIPPYQELALCSFENNSKASPLQGRDVPQGVPLMVLLATRPVIQVKSHDIPNSDVQGVKREERTVCKDTACPR